jgi:YD repeat-containing protein
VADNYGRQILFTYNLENLVSEAATPAGNYLYAYDGIGNLTGKTNPDLTTRSYAYTDDPHNLTGLTDENGVLGRLLRVTTARTRPS